MLFDRIWHQNGTRHLLTAPYSPTATGNVERFHKILRQGFLFDHDRRHATVDDLQRALDGWVEGYNHDRPHQSLGDRPPVERLVLADRTTSVDAALPEDVDDDGGPGPRPPG